MTRLLKTALSLLPELEGPGSLRPCCASSGAGISVCASPLMASTYRPGMQKSRDVYVSSKPPQPAVRSARDGQRRGCGARVGSGASEAVVVGAVLEICEIVSVVVVEEDDEGG